MAIWVHHSPLTFLRSDTKHGSGFMPKHSSFSTSAGWRRKANGFPHFRRTRFEFTAKFPPVIGGMEPPAEGCHGEGIELPTSLPASDAKMKNKISVIFGACHQRMKMKCIEHTKILEIFIFQSSCKSTPNFSHGFPISDSINKSIFHKSLPARAPSTPDAFFLFTVKKYRKSQSSAI